MSRASPCRDGKYGQPCAGFFLENKNCVMKISTDSFVLKEYIEFTERL